MKYQTCLQDIGYKGEIGYQTFLYSSETEIRSLLMFLVEKLPRENAEASDQPTGTGHGLIFKWTNNAAYSLSGRVKPPVTILGCQPLRLPTRQVIGGETLC